MGILLSVIAAFCFAGAGIAVRLGTRHISTGLLTVVSIISGGVIAAIISVLLFWEEMTTLTTNALIWFVLLAFVNFPVGRFLQFTSIHLAGAVRSAPMVGTQPLFATIFAILLLQEKVTPLLIAGVLAIASGAILIARESARS